VFVKAYTNLKNFKGESKFSTWIYKIGYYASLDAVKRNNRQINTDTIDEIYDGDIGILQDALFYLEEKERKSIIKKALLKLNEDEQIILTLYYFEEMPLKEISKIVNLSLDNIKVKLFRARKKLATILKNVIEPRTINLK
jgi:RNA polymerase sigma-70 factor (ECF subfamily)